MSTRNMYEYVTGEFTQISILQEPAGVDVKPIFDQNSVQLAGYDIEIWTDGGIQLIEAVDYTLQLRDDSKSSAEGFDIWGGYLIIDAAYQDIELSVISKIVGGYTFRTYRPTYLNVSADSQIDDFDYDDIVVYADTDSQEVALTVGPANRKNQMLTVVASGANKCTIFRDGFNEVSILDQGTQFAFNGSVWVQLGATGGGAGNSLAVGQAAWYAGIGTVPVDKLLCDGSIYSIQTYPSLFNALGTTYGGDGLSTFGVPNLQGIFPGAQGVQGTHGDAGWNIGDLIEDSFESHDHIQDAHNHVQDAHGHQVPTGTTGTYGDVHGPISAPVTMLGGTNSPYAGVGTNAPTGGNPFIVSETPTNQAATATNQETGGTETRPASLIGRWLIQAFDSVQEVPADPGLVKDYNLVWEGVPSATVINEWGEGLFFIGVEYTYIGAQVLSNAFMGVAIDGNDREIIIDVDQVGGDSEVRARYVFATNSFELSGSGTDFTNPIIRAIYKWGDVATGELDPPVDGWETVFDDPANVGPVLNSWGYGQYRVMVYKAGGATLTTSFLTINPIDFPSATQIFGSQAVGAENAGAYYSTVTNEFVPFFESGTWYIAKIDKFNSLVNVVHSYTHDVGYIYTQYPNKKSPIELGIPGTWTDISSEMAGLFFRAEGGAASAFESGTQAEEFKEHTHIQNQHRHLYYGSSSLGGSSDATMMNGDRLNNKTNYDEYTTPTNQNSGGVETRPVNTTIRLWERTA